ncbi:unnamed protein product, partial [Discosporangium mesarthrocarpum]
RNKQVIVWNVGMLCTARKGGGGGGSSSLSVTRGMAIAARQISDFPITHIAFSPYEKQRLVSCGRENVRFWRIRRRHLPACPAVLNEFARGLECTDLAFESPYGRTVPGVGAGELAASATATPVAGGLGLGIGGGDAPRIIYVATRAGTLLQVSYQTRNLLCVLRLHNGPILSLAVNEGFAVTASADRFLRLWPLDFSDFLMEAEHESAVVSASLSMDGLKLAVGTEAGSVGLLDVMSHAYTTVLRSHRGRVSACALDPAPRNGGGGEFATVGEDNTIR